MSRPARPRVRCVPKLGAAALLALSLALACDWSSGSSPSRTPSSSGATPSPQPSAQPRPQPAPPADPFVEISAGNQHSCARRRSGAVVCWGRNTYGQLGDGSREDSAKRVAVTGLVDAVELAAGGDFSCARRKAGSVVCWGNNQDGQLGDGRGAKVGVWSTKPTGVAGLSDAVALGAGEAFACALKRGGQVLCWGEGANGQIGTQGERAFATPQVVPGVSSIVSLGVGGRHVCAAERGGAVKCWGRNNEGQLGDGGITSRSNPRPVTGLGDAVSLVSGGRHSCARRRGGELSCWGDGRQGQLGLGPDIERERQPRPVGGLAGLKELFAGDQHTCALFSASDLRCWGDNSAGQLDSTRRPRTTPTKLGGVRGVADVAAGYRHTCVISGGEVYCWGLAERGALGPNPRS